MAQAIIEANELKVESTQVATHKDEGPRRKVACRFPAAWAIARSAESPVRAGNRLALSVCDNLVVRSSVRESVQACSGVEPDVLVQFELYAFTRSPNRRVKKP